MIKVILMADFVKLKKGDVIEAAEHPENPAVWVIGNGGDRLYVPKAICELTEDWVTVNVTSAKEEVKRTPVFDPDTTVAPQTEVQVSDYERMVVSRVTEGIELEGDEGTTISSSGFNADKSLTMEEKRKAAEEARLKEARDRLSYVGEPQLQEGQFWLTDLTEGTLPDSGVNHKVTCHLMSSWVMDPSTGKWDQQLRTDYPWFSDTSVTDVPDIDYYYMWDANVLEAVILGSKLNERTLLSGPPGTGKTSAVRQFAAWTDHPYMRFNGKEDIDRSSFLGSPWISGGAMEWRDGLLPQGLKLNYIICIDEVFKIPPGIQMAMQSLYENDGFLMLDDKPGTLFDKMVYPGKQCRLFLTDNVKGTGDASELFAATQMQDTSTIDRFGITVDVPYLSEHKEIDMLVKKYPTAETGSIKKLVQFANMVREGYLAGKISLTMSPRGLACTLDIMTTQGLPERYAMAYSFTNKISNDQEKQAIKQHERTVWG